MLGTQQKGVSGNRDAFVFSLEILNPKEDYKWCGTFFAFALAGGTACRCGAVRVVP
jgi:hypothetical protein